MGLKLQIDGTKRFQANARRKQLPRCPFAQCMLGGLFNKGALAGLAGASQKMSRVQHLSCHLPIAYAMFRFGLDYASTNQTMVYALGRGGDQTHIFRKMPPDALHVFRPSIDDWYFIIKTIWNFRLVLAGNVDHSEPCAFKTSYDENDVLDHSPALQNYQSPLLM